MKRWSLVVTLILGVLLLNLYINSKNRSDSGNLEELANLPWKITVQDDGTTSVFGVWLEHDTLASAIDHIGPDVELALITAPDEAPSLELYYSSFTAGILGGKLILVADADPQWMEQAVTRAVKVKRLSTGARLITLNADDQRHALTYRVKTITFVPSIQLDKAIALQRFGEPASTIVSKEGREHLLYPQTGLDLLLDQQGKEVLQYISPKAFDQLAGPLQDKDGK